PSSSSTYSLLHSPPPPSHPPPFPTRRSSDLPNKPSAKTQAKLPAARVAECMRGCSQPGLAVDRNHPSRASFKAFNSLVGHNFTQDRKSTRLNSSHVSISYAVFCLKKKNKLQH